MQDDTNTFPIPQTNTPTDANAASTPVDPNSQLGFTPAPPPVVTDQATTTQPQWVDQSAQDATALADQGVNNYSVAPNQASDQSAMSTNPVAPQPEAISVGQQAMTASPEMTMPQAQSNPLETPSIQSVAAEPVTSMQSTPVPSSNTLDLSGTTQSVSPTPVAQEPASTPGMMQPGVDIAPVTNNGYDPSAMGDMPADFGGASFNTDAANMADLQTSSNKKPLKFIIIGVAALALVLVLGLVLVLVSRNDRAPAVELNQEIVDTTQTSSSTPAAIPDGFKQVTRDCYGFGVMTPTTLNFANTTCSIKAKFGSSSQYDISVAPVTDSVPDLQALVDLAKQGNITSQEDITLNGIAAKKVVQTINGLDVQTVVVIPTGKNYQFNGKTVNGFIINTSDNDDTAKKASSTLISTWEWK